MDLRGWTANWKARTVAVAVLGPDGVIASHGPADHGFELASVTKLFTAWTVLVAAEEESIDLDDVVVGEAGTVADVLAHASGLGPAGEQITAPGTRRIYSNAGYELLGDLVHERSGMAFADYMHLALFEPLGMAGASLNGSSAHAATASLDDLVAFGRELLTPTILSTETVGRAITPHRPELAGVLPGYGKQSPNPWGLGPEIRGAKAPHWTASSNSGGTFGHFGQTGTFMWVDPDRSTACIALTDQPFGEWAIEAWPPFNAHVVEALT